MLNFWLHNLNSGTSEKVGNFPDNGSSVLDKIFWRSDDKALYHWRYGKLRELSLESKQIKTVFTYHDISCYNNVLDIHQDTIYFRTAEKSVDSWVVEGR